MFYNGLIMLTYKDRAMKLINRGLKNCVVSYSCGKDSALALHRAIICGFMPKSLITTYNEEKDSSWFHSIPEPLLKQVGESLGIEMTLIKTKGDEYTSNFELVLEKFKNEGVDVCIFGDIDIEEHIDWCSERCKNVGIEPFFPLLNEPRISLVYEFINSGFITHITTIDTSRMDGKLLGKALTINLVEKLIVHGIDPCGESGEFHTFTSDGPIFKKPVLFRFGNMIYRENHVSVLLYSPLASSK